MMAKRAARASWNVDKPPIALQPCRSSDQSQPLGVRFAGTHVTLV